MKFRLMTLVALLLALTLALGAALADTAIDGALKTDIALKSEYPDNEIADGLSPLTGLDSADDSYTPVMIVLDNAEDAYPHWGVKDADILLQIPNEGGGATKLLAIFGGSYPEQAGGVRSARATMVPVAAAFDAAFAYAGCPTLDGDSVSVAKLLRSMQLTGARERSYNLLGKNYRERVTFVSSPHNLSAHVSEIHEKLVADGVTFEKRAFRFTDEARTDGEAATHISITHRGNDAATRSNPASYSEFDYDEAHGAYTRTNSSGVYTDRDTGETLYFANVIVLRVGIRSQDGYLYLADHLVGSGVIEVFQNGRYVRGAWTRDSLTGRLVLVGPDGEELEMQRGRSFIVVTNDVTEVTYR